MAEVLELSQAPPLEEDDEAGVLPPFVLQLEPVIRMDEEQFFQFCGLNRDLRIERTAGGEIILMFPAGPSSSAGNAELTRLFANWAKRDGTGRIFDSSAGFRLPNKAVRSPDVSWVPRERIRALGKDAWTDGFLQLCPDFALELRSKTDSIPVLKRKMAEYMDNGSRLGWLINPSKRTVFIYRPGSEPEELHDPEELSGESVLPGFVLKLADLWDAIAGEA